MHAGRPTSIYEMENEKPNNPFEGFGEKARTSSNPNAPVPEEERQRIKDLAIKGLSMGEIARELKRSKSTVPRVLQSLKISKRKRRNARTGAWWIPPFALPAPCAPAARPGKGNLHGWRFLTIRREIQALDIDDGRGLRPPEGSGGI